MEGFEINFRMNKFLIISLLAIATAMAGCYYDVEEEIYPTLECQTDGVTYSGVVLPILQNNCFVCHSAAANFGNITLEGYQNLKIRVDNGQLLGAIRHKSGFSPMPQGAPQLVECNIQKIEAWVAQGAPEN